jgi:hypothetical protein
VVDSSIPVNKYIIRPKTKPAITSLAKWAPSIILVRGIKIKTAKVSIFSSFFIKTFLIFSDIMYKKKQRKIAEITA